MEKRLEVLARNKIYSRVLEFSKWNTASQNPSVMGETSVRLRSRLEINPVPCLRASSVIYPPAGMRSVSEKNLSARLRSLLEMSFSVEIR